MPRSSYKNEGNRPCSRRAGVIGSRPCSSVLALSISSTASRCQSLLSPSPPSSAFSHRARLPLLLLLPDVRHLLGTRACPCRPSRRPQGRGPCDRRLVRRSGLRGDTVRFAHRRRRLAPVLRHYRCLSASTGSRSDLVPQARGGVLAARGRAPKGSHRAGGCRPPGRRRYRFVGPCFSIPPCGALH